MLSSCDLGTFKFSAKLLVRCSSQFSLFNGANFFLFSIAISSGKVFSVINIRLGFLEGKMKLFSTVFSSGNKVMKRIRVNIVSTAE